MEHGTEYGAGPAETIFKSNSEFQGFGIYGGILLIVGCTGGLAVGLGGVNALFSLICLVIPTMTTLSLLIALAPMKILVPAALATTIINLLFIAYYLIA